MDALTVLHRAKVPQYCEHCGEPLPWTADVLASAGELIDLIDELKPEDRAALKERLPDLIADTPYTEVAAIRTAKLLGSVEPHFREAFKQIIYALLAAKAQAILKSMGFWTP